MNVPLFPFREYHTDGTIPGPDRIFVFGSNTGGRHGKSGALIAAKFFGAVEGVGQGRTGQAYAIATRMQKSESNGWIVNRDITEVAIDIARFVEYTQQNTDLEYYVTAVGCGNAGFQPAQIAPLFREAVNCSFPSVWKFCLDESDHSAFENHKRSM